MDQIGKMKAARSHDLVHQDNFREDQCPAADENKGHQHIQHRPVGYFLKRVELPPAIYGEWGFFAPEDTKQVIVCLKWNFFLQPAPSHAVVKAVFREQVSEKDN